MPDRPPFPIPENKTPETYCLEIVMPNDPTWKAVIAGLLWLPAEWFNWQRDEEKSGKQLAQYWRDIYNNIDWSDMSCCCKDKTSSPPSFYRVNDLGQMETSNDGGVTWVVNTTQDYRYNSGQFPPVNPEALGDDAKCQSANNVLAYLQHSQSEYNDAWSVSGDIGALVAAVLALIQEVGLLTGFTALTIAAAGFPYLLVLGVVVAAYYFGRSAWDASFSDEFWADVLCAIYCHISDDGTVTNDGFMAMLSDINNIGFSAARLYIWAVVNSMGSVGLTNAARTMSSSVESCDECCPECQTLFEIYGEAGTIDSTTDEYIECTAEISALTGTWTVGLTTNDPDVCCSVEKMTIGDVEVNFTAAWALCGEAIPTTTFPHGGLTLPLLTPMNSLLIYQPAPFTVKVYFI